ncbi:MAG: GNAT family N-acetyltransferase [Balneolaceae bacterium]
MSQTLSIRKATPGDAGSLIDFNIAMAMETEQKQLDRATIEPGVHALFSNPEYGFYLVAERGGGIVGSLMITTEWSDWRNGLFWWIQSVYVLPGHRRQGIYRSMYQKVKELAGETSGVCGFRLYVEKENRVAQQTYRELGMEETPYKMFEEMNV